MSINPLGLNTQTNASTTAQAQPATAGSSAATRSASLEWQKVSASFSFSASVTDGDKYYELLYQATYESISTRLGLNDSAPAQPQKPDADAGGKIDVSPEATAKRIVDMSTAFLAAFKKQHPDEDDDTVLKRFMDTIGGGIEQGFKEARGILDGLGVLKGDIAGNIDKTWELVQKGLKDFAEKTGKPMHTQDGMPTPATSPTDTGS